MGKKNGVEQPPSSKALAEIRAVVGRARQGDAGVLPQLRELLDQHPDIWRRFGDLGAQAEMAWASLASGPDLLLRESLLRQAQALREELAGPSPSPVEELLVERVVACWLQLHYFDATEAQALNSDEKPRLANFRAKRQEQAHRAYLGALAALTTLRKLLPPAPTGALLPAKPEPPARTDRHGQAGELPPVFPNRLSRYFDQPPDPRKAKRRPVAGVGADQ